MKFKELSEQIIEPDQIAHPYMTTGAHYTKQL